MKSKLCFLVLTFGVNLFSYASTAKNSVSWRKGNVEEAISEAKEAHRPILLYWGAAWCPPCNVLKSTVFTDGQFIEASKEYVTIYLDGDTKDAQKWGDRLKVSSYPTLLVVNSDLEEIQRIQTESTAKDLAQELIKIKKEMKSFPDQVTDALKLADASKISEKFWLKLANYPWELDPIWMSDKKTLLKNLQALKDKIPANLPELKTSLEITILKILSEDTSDENKLTDADRKRAIALLKDVFSDDHKLETHFSKVIWSLGTFVEFIYPEENAERINTTRLTMELRSKLWKWAKRKNLGPLDRLATYVAIVSLSNGSNINFPVLSIDEKNLVKEECLAQLKAAKDEYQIHAVLDSVASLYKDIGEIIEARKLVLNYSKSLVDKNLAYSLLSDLDLAEGKVESSLAWSKKAYEVAKVGPTKTQWAAIYFSDFSEVNPHNEKEVLNLAKKIIEEGMNYSDSFNGRNIRSLNRIRKSLQTWSTKNQFPINDAILSQIEKNKCGSFDNNFQISCHSYLAEFKK